MKRISRVGFAAATAACVIAALPFAARRAEDRVTLVTAFADRKRALAAA